MSDKPIISIIIPCFNYGRFILNTISNVEKCDSDLYELIIVNDGSTDLHTREILNSLEQRGYHVINQENKGVSAARNAGIKVANGKYILPLDADDEIYPSYLPLALNLLNKEPEIGVVYGRAEYFGTQQGEWQLPNQQFDVKRLLLFNYIYISGIYRKSIWTECGGYDTEMSEWEDWDFWLSVAERGWKFAQLDCLVFRYRIHELSKMHVHRCNEKVSDEAERYVMWKHHKLYRSQLIEMYDATSRLNHWENNPIRGIFRLFLTQLKILTKKVFKESPETGGRKVI